MDVMVVVLLVQTLEPLITLLRRNEELFMPRTTLYEPDTSNSSNQTEKSNKIPRILHQTTATEKIPERWIESQRSCGEAYADFEYKVSI